MEKLIEALQIFLKYANPTWPTHCEHDILIVHSEGGEYHPDNISEEDVTKLDKLGFTWDEGDEHFYSFKYGSC